MKELTIIPKEHNKPSEIDNSISVINQPLCNFLEHVGLPTDNLLSPIDERRKVIESLESVLELMDVEVKKRATYLSKFSLCVTVGLFDGALSFLWDETIKELRKKIIEFDIEYFYSIAQSFSSRYKGLSDPKEITAIGEHDLLEICRRIGLLDDVNHRRLENVNYFRNHASAAHPNDNNISGIELLSFLENCLRYAICAPLEQSVIQVKRLLENVRKHKIEESDFALIGDQVKHLERQSIEDIFQAMFGMYCDLKSDQGTINNINGIAPIIWNFITENLKFKIGAKFGYYRANADVPKREKVQEFLHLVNGNKYKDEDSLGVEILEKLQHLRSAHYSYNNFYNEYPHAQSIEQSLPKAGLPNSVVHEFVKIISTCYIGNGNGFQNGIDENAMPLYSNFLDRIDEKGITAFVKLFEDHEFIGDLHKFTPRKRVNDLCDIFIDKSTNVLLVNVLEFIKKFPKLEKMKNTTEYKELIEKL